MYTSTRTCLLYGGEFPWVQILVQMPADVPEEILVGYILKVCGR